MGSNKKKSNYFLFPLRLVNKYLIASFLFLGWIIFFDKYNLVNQHKLSQTVKKLENEKQDYLEKLENAKAEKLTLEKNKERYAREKYFMHKDNEDVYIIEREDQ